MIETFTYENVFDAGILQRYRFMETGSATRIAEAVCPEEFSDVKDVLSRFVLTSRLLLTRGGNRGPIARTIDGAFHRRGWMEARVDLYKRTFLFPGQNAPAAQGDPFGAYANDHLVSETYQQGYSVDNVKGRVSLDVEWNPKDGNLDRDFAAYRAWHDEGLIDLAILITRIHEDSRDITDEAWAEFIKKHPRYSREKQLVSYRTTTTANFEKARERVLRGDLGTCPILVVGIGRNTWDGVPWDGMAVVYDSESESLKLRDAFDDKSPMLPYDGNI